MGGEPLESPPMCTEIFEQLVTEREVCTVFQPIVDGNSRTVIGHEALTRENVLENLRKIKILAKEGPGSRCLIERQGQITDLVGLATRTPWASVPEALALAGV